MRVVGTSPGGNTRRLSSVETAIITSRFSESVRPWPARVRALVIDIHRSPAGRFTSAALYRATLLRPVCFVNSPVLRVNRLHEVVGRLPQFALDLLWEISVDSARKKGDKPGKRETQPGKRESYPLQCPAE